MSLFSTEYRKCNNATMSALITQGLANGSNNIGEYSRLSQPSWLFGAL